MDYVCGSFQVRLGGEFGDYSDLEEYVTGSGAEGLLLGEDASDFMAFHAVEVYQPFTGEKFRIGMILDGSREFPGLCPIHGKASLAIGMNNAVQIIDLNEHSISARFELGSWFQYMLCNGKVLVAVHELGASVIQLSTLEEIANADCDVVSDVSLSEDELLLVSMDEETIRVDLSATHEECS